MQHNKGLDRFFYFDWINFFLICLISCIGLGIVASATYHTHAPWSFFLKKQLLGIISGFCIYWLCISIDNRTMVQYGYWGYCGVILLLLFTLVKGSIGMGAQRWIDIGIIKFQPSELTKLFLPLFFACQVQNNISKKQLTLFAPLLTIIITSFFLVRKQPDLGTALIILFSGLLLCWFAEINHKFFIYIGLICIIGAPVLWHTLHDYQKKRIFVFMGYGNQKKEGYQKQQALIAIGSGGLFGKGILKGTQNKLKFLPESRTDFAFAVLCEECGFFGALVLIILYLILFTRMLLSLPFINNNIMQLCAFGLSLHIILSTMINIGMVLGLLPIVGIPLPLISYGITNIWITFASFGIFQNITMDRMYRIHI